MTRASLTAVAILALAAAGCGSKSSPSAKTTAPPPVTGADNTKALAAVLQIADFPSGWKQALRTQSTPDPDCQEIADTRAASTSREEAGSFTLGRAAKVQSVVYAFPDAATASKTFKSLGSNPLRSCIAKITRALVSGVSGIKAGHTSNLPLTVPSVGSDRFAFRVAVPISTKKQRAELDQDIVLVRSGRAISVTAMVQESPTFSASLRNRLVSAAAKRLSASFPA